ncbi:MAG: large conductance mechanosensitive channel protein MscL [Thermomicrobiales bacterium]|jgi:large conductance mechanosensitive channel
MQNTAREFKQFLLRGNVVDLAVAIVIGIAFGAVINSLVNDLLMPVIAMIFGKPDFSNLTFTINNAVFRYGAFITAVITFVLIAAAVFFFVVKPINMLIARRRTEAPADPSTMNCPFCLSEVPTGATRCAFCTSELAAAAA